MTTQTPGPLTSEATASPGRAAYEAYWPARSGTVPCPWGHLADGDRAAWEAAAEAAAGASTSGDVPPAELAYLLKMLDCTDIGRAAYAGYCASGGGKSLISGVPIPDWEIQSGAIKRAWQAAAEFVVGELADSLSALAGERRSDLTAAREQLAAIRSVLLEGGQDDATARRRAIAILGHIVTAPGVNDLTATGNGPLLDPDVGQRHAHAQSHRRAYCRDPHQGRQLALFPLPVSLLRDTGRGRYLNGEMIVTTAEIPAPARDPLQLLEEIRKRAQAATKGPWVSELRPGRADDIVTAQGWGVANCGPKDAEFIAHARSDIPRLLSGYDALLNAHQPGRHAIIGTTCKRHEAHRHFSIDVNEAASVRDCPDCTATVYTECTGCSGVDVDRCRTRALIATALSGEEVPAS